MKKNTTLLLITFFFFTKTLPGDNNTYVNVYASTNQVTSASNTITSMQQTVPAALLKELAHGSESFMNNNKLFIAAVAGAYAYGRTFASIVNANHKLACDKAWSTWKAEFLLEELKNQDPKILTKELLFEIQKRHITVEKPADALLPFITFLNTIDEEIANLNHYRSLHFWLESCHATWLFPVNKNRFASVTMRLERLWFIRNLFLSWAAEYKLSTFTPRSTFSKLSQLYTSIMNRLNLSPSSPNQSSHQNTHTKTILTTFAETVCCAQAAALIGALVSPTGPVKKVITNTIHIAI